MLDSVRFRLTLWYTLVLAVVLVFLALLSYFIYQRNIFQRTDANLVELADTFATTFSSELPDEQGSGALVSAAREAMIEHRFRDTIFVVLDSSAAVLLSSLDLPAGGPPREQVNRNIFDSESFRELATAALPLKHGMRTVHGGKSGFRGYARNLAVGNQSYRLVVLQSLHSQREMMEAIRNTFLWAIPLALLLASAGGYFLARKSLAPVSAMASQAQTIGASNLQKRLEVANTRDELGHLALSFNQLLERLDKSFERQQRFIADASHELRTPVAILHGEAEVTLSRNDRSPQDYRESLGILRDESQRLARIIEDLFTLTRADAGQYPLTLRDAYLDELASEALTRARSLALTKNITLTSAIDPDLPARLDEALIGRMLLNLLDNAIKYSPPGSTVNLACSRLGDHYLLSVSDNGPGIPADLQPRIFERFFRADKARSRSEGDSGGAGLGLSIARWIAEVHHGRLELTRSDSSGTTFTAYLPEASV
jgi:heavy metal sensor kinase